MQVGLRASSQPAVSLPACACVVLLLTFHPGEHPRGGGAVVATEGAHTTTLPKKVVEKATARTCAPVREQVH